MAESKALQAYNPNQFNVLQPAVLDGQTGEMHVLSVSVVQVDPNPDHGDVYKVGSRKEGNQWVDIYAPAKPALERMASAAGIVWNWRESGVIVDEPRRVVYRAVAAIQSPGGQWVPLVQEKEVDLDVVEEELRLQYEEKADDLIENGGLSYKEAKRYNAEWKQEQQKKVAYLPKSQRERWVEDKVRANMVQWKKNKRHRAETGAQLRVIRKALALKQQFTAAELQKPFVVPRVEFRPNYRDPQVQKLLLERGNYAAGQVFGPSPSSEVFAMPNEPDMPKPPEEGKYVGVGGEPVAPEEEAALDALREAEDAQDVPEDEPFHEDELDGVEPEVPEALVCAECGVVIEPAPEQGWTKEKIYDFMMRQYGRVLCQEHRKAGGAK